MLGRILISMRFILVICFSVAAKTLKKMQLSKEEPYLFKYKCVHCLPLPQL